MLSNKLADENNTCKLLLKLKENLFQNILHMTDYGQIIGLDVAKLLHAVDWML